MNAITVDTPQGHSGMLANLSPDQFSFRYAPAASERTAVCLAMPVRYADYPQTRPANACGTVTKHSAQTIVPAPDSAIDTG